MKSTPGSGARTVLAVSTETWKRLREHADAHGLVMQRAAEFAVAFWLDNGAPAPWPKPDPKNTHQAAERAPS